MRSLALLLFFAASATAGAQAAQPKPTTPAHTVTDSAKVATYDLEVTTDDGTMTGVLSVKRAANGLAADLTVGGNSPAVSSFAREGDVYVLKAGHGTFTFVYTLTFRRDSLAGSFKGSGGLNGTVIGGVRR
jgi:hypothetical protein